MPTWTTTCVAFQTLVGADYKAETISVYGKRIRNAIKAYEYYLEHGKPPAFRTGVARQDNGDTKPKSKAAPKPKAAKSPAEVEVPEVPEVTSKLVVFPFPLRGGQMAQFHLPPTGLTPGDADRISAFMRTLSFAEQQQIPRKTGEDEEQQAA